MKKYNTTASIYGQSTIGRINYYQKMGVSSGIKEIVLNMVRNEGLDISDWKKEYHVGEKTIKQLELTLVIPTPNNSDILDYPHFEYNGKSGYIDMIHFDTTETQFHIMYWDYKTDTFTNGGWHTVREGLSLEDTCLLFEYVEDRLNDMVILTPDNTDKYNSTGALGIGL